MLNFLRIFLIIEVWTCLHSMTLSTIFLQNFPISLAGIFSMIASNSMTRFATDVFQFGSFILMYPPNIQAIDTVSLTQQFELNRRDIWVYQANQCPGCVDDSDSMSPRLLFLRSIQI